MNNYLYVYLVSDNFIILYLSPINEAERSPSSIDLCMTS